MCLEFILGLGKQGKLCIFFPSQITSTYPKKETSWQNAKTCFQMQQNRKKMGKQNVFHMPSWESDRKFIILVPFLVKIASFIALCWENSSPLAAPLVVHARRAQFARFGWKHSDKVKLLVSDWMHSPRLTV